MVDNILVRGIQSLNELGLSDVLLPFLLIFTIMFAVLQKTKVLGKDDEGDYVSLNFFVLREQDLSLPVRCIRAGVLFHTELIHDRIPPFLS